MSNGISLSPERWGPYSPTYLGISKVLPGDGSRILDCAIHVGRVAPEILITPDNTFGYGQRHADGERRTIVSAIPETVSSDYRETGLRYFFDQTETSDQAEVVFTVKSPEAIECALTFYNNSSEPRDYFTGISLVPRDEMRRVKLKPAECQNWIAAHNYSSLKAYQKTFGMGCRQCVSRAFNWGVEAFTLAQAFGGWPEDEVCYDHALIAPVERGYLYFRYIKYGALSHLWELRVEDKCFVLEFPQTFALPGGAWGKNRDNYQEWGLIRVAVGALPEGNLQIALRPIDPPCNDQARIWLDGIWVSDGLLPGDAGEEGVLNTDLLTEVLPASRQVVCESASKGVVRFGEHDAYPFQLEADNGELTLLAPQGSLLKTLSQKYRCSETDTTRDTAIQEWLGFETTPVTVPGHSRKTLRCTLRLQIGDQKTQASTRALSSAPPLSGPFQDLAKNLRATLLFNINHPYLLNQRNTPYFVPAKFFPLPYFWDGGFIALGLAGFASEAAKEQAVYFFSSPEEDFPFFYCGSPVPTPIYALWEIFQHEGDVEFLRQAYAGAKRMYDFYWSRTPGSEVNRFHDGYLSTYAYNYNLGIDDHPIQRWAEENKLTQNGLYSPILLTQVLRCGKILRNIAHLLGNMDDVTGYQNDCRRLTEIIEHEMWDAQSGLYGWLWRNDQQQVVPFLVNGDFGDQSACSFLPLFAGLDTQTTTLKKALLDPKRFFTPHGISSVDMSAPYYHPDGYWNGGIWTVMQWYIWRGLLEVGEIDLAREIAEKILQTWAGGLRSHHYLGEHFRINSEKMSGVPNFGGLSAVLLPMQETYFTKQAITLPYEVILHERVFSNAPSETVVLELSAPYLKADSFHLLINLQEPQCRYGISGPSGEAQLSTSDVHGHTVFRLPRPQNRESWRIQRAG